MPEPVFSLVSSAIRSENYKRCYDSFVQDSKIPVEIIFVGDNPPKEFIGDNFRYIYSSVKPAQCIEIGARESTGKYIFIANDDYIFSDHFVDNAYQKINELDTTKYILSFVYYPSCIWGQPLRDCRNGVAKIPTYYGKEVGDFTCFPREIWKKLGGIDKQFIHTWADLDLLLRCYEIGMILHISHKGHIREVYPPISSEEMQVYNNNRMWRKYKRYSTILMEFLWIRAGFKIAKKRLCSAEPFKDKDIKIITQGEKGEWL